MKPEGQGNKIIVNHFLLNVVSTKTQKYLYLHIYVHKFFSLYLEKWLNIYYILGQKITLKSIILTLLESLWDSHSYVKLGWGNTIAQTPPFLKNTDLKIDIINIKQREKSPKCSSVTPCWGLVLLFGDEL